MINYFVIFTLLNLSDLSTKHIGKSVYVLVLKYVGMSIDRIGDV
jgi:hypothetical protein